MKALFCLAIGFFLLLPPSAWACPPCEDALSGRVLEMFQDEDETVSLGAMLVCDQVRRDECLVEYVLASRSPSDSVLARTVKNYYLAVARYFEGPGRGYAYTFIEEFPEDPDDFEEVLSFDAGLTRTVSGRMIMELVDMADCRRPPQLRAAARAKLERLRLTQERAGWAAEIFPETLPACAR